MLNLTTCWEQPSMGLRLGSGIPARTKLRKRASGGSGSGVTSPLTHILAATAIAFRCGGLGCNALATKRLLCLASCAHGRERLQCWRVGVGPELPGDREDQDFVEPSHRSSWLGLLL